MKIVITGGAGLVGQNLLVRLLARGFEDVHVLDKASHNLALARDTHPGANFLQADLSRRGPWENTVAAADVVVMLHAQIGGNVRAEFHNNNVVATQNVLRVMSPEASLVHISSSVLESSATDDYKLTKEQQEELVVSCGRPYTVLRPTLMFGWFDRKHFGWLARFMSKTPIFPVPGDGKYVRQPLYAGDFCDIILACITGGPRNTAYNISGKEKITYIDIIRTIRRVQGSRSLLLHLPYGVFYALLWCYALFDRNPPFTTAQLQALVLDEVFQDMDWEGEFGVEATPFETAISDTFTHPVYSKLRLKF